MVKSVSFKRDGSPLYFQCPRVNEVSASCITRANVFSLALNPKSLFLFERVAALASDNRSSRLTFRFKETSISAYEGNGIFLSRRMMCQPMADWNGSEMSP